MNHVVFLSYGSGPHVDETRFAILSAVHQDGPQDGSQDLSSPQGYEIVVVTDDPSAYANLGVQTELVTAAQIREWAGPVKFDHRIKICALAHVMQQRPGPAALVDGDSYFLHSPAQLFERIGPDKTIMHLCEGQIGHLVALGYNRQRLMQMSHDLGAAGRYNFSAATTMWNSGVVGLHPDSTPLFDQILALNDAIHAAVPTNVSEQLAFGSVLDRHTRLTPARDIVFHYHQDFMRNPFRHRLPELMRQTANLPPAQRAAALWPHRPLPPQVKVIKAALKRPLKRFGFFRHDLETSV